jgi:hypothetical protein
MRVAATRLGKALLRNNCIILNSCYCFNYNNEAILPAYDLPAMKLRYPYNFSKRPYAILAILALLLLGFVFAWLAISREKEKGQHLQNQPPPVSARQSTQALQPFMHKLSDKLNPALAIPASRDNKAQWCGYDKLNEDEISKLSMRSEKQAHDVLLGETRRLMDSESARDRAFGMYADAQLAGVEASLRHYLSRPECQSDEACQKEQFTQSVTASLQAAAPLLRAAADTRDPTLYASAYYLCQQDASSNPACASMSAARWGQLDPGNAAPWLALAAQAMARQDRAAALEALFQLSKASRLDYRQPYLPAMLADIKLDTLPSAVQVMLADELIGAHLAQPILPLIGLQPCLKADPADSNMQQLCSNVAAFMLHNANNLVDLTVATRMAQNLHWDPAHLANLKADLMQVREAMQKDATSYPENSCAWLQQLPDYVHQMNQYGELGAIRKRALPAHSQAKN